MIRRLGSHAGKRIYFGYDRYIRPELIAYREVIRAHGALVDAVGDDAQLHYLTSAELVCTAVQTDPESFGILCCGTGMGMSIAANKFAGIYAARCMSVEDSELARTINNSNMLCIAAKSGIELNTLIVDTFVRTAFTGRKLDELELITRFEGLPAPSLRVVRRTA
ncbi:MAG: RpiB/LacA/LacB family sugar-phosphate isomerase [Deltaproteobacteria bacterium]|nr:RpiB/LacA/LacB family sugar-phosphate isomerase [Deltaproteobacteria bacterium]